MIYRWMDLPSQPQFSFTEKLFLSGRKHHRVMGHTILMFRSLGIFLLPFVMLGGIALGVTVVGTGFIWGYCKLSHWVNNTYHTGHFGFALLFVSIVVAMAGIIRLGDIIKINVRDNSKLMAKKIRSKLNADSKPEV